MVRNAVSLGLLKFFGKRAFWLVVPERVGDAGDSSTGLSVTLFGNRRATRKASQSISCYTLVYLTQGMF